MKYMEAVINETLRMYPPAHRVERIVTENIEYGDLRLKKGQVILIPVYALHHDPNLYPEPDTFRPERFLDSDDSGSSIIKTLPHDSITFLPFGAGPRSCLGMRFAMVEIKILLATILTKFKFITSPETPVCCF